MPSLLQPVVSLLCPPAAPPAPPRAPGHEPQQQQQRCREGAAAVLWDCELNQEKRTWTVKPQKEGKQDSKLLLSTICLGEKAKEEMNLVEILPPASPEDKQAKPITIASLQASVLPMVVVMGLELSPPVTFQLRAGSGPVFLGGQECYIDTADVSWEERRIPRRRRKRRRKVTVMRLMMTTMIRCVPRGDPC
uniref:Nucleoplasmin-2 n=1 Tax=Canis lupus familiaris TaxID=9615 RepID=A0A8C0QC75_CANLF